MRWRFEVKNLTEIFTFIMHLECMHCLCFFLIQDIDICNWFYKYCILYSIFYLAYLYYLIAALYLHSNCLMLTIMESCNQVNSIIFWKSGRAETNFVVGQTVIESSQKCTPSIFENRASKRPFITTIFYSTMLWILVHIEHLFFV